MPEDISSTTGASVSCPASEAVTVSAPSPTTTTTTTVVPTQCHTPTTIHVNQSQQCAITMVTEQCHQPSVTNITDNLKPLVSCQMPVQTAVSQVQVAPPASTVVRASLPHVQVIHQPIQSPSFLQQQHYMVQQQFMFHNAVQAAMQAQGISPQLTLTPVGPNKPGSIGPVSNVTLQSPLPQVTQAGQMKSVVVAQSGGAASQTAKPMAGKAATVNPQQQTVIPQQQAVIPQQQTVIPQQQTTAAMFGQKPLLQRQPVVIGQLGVLPTQASLVGQPKSPIVGQNSQMIKSPTQIRFSNQPTLVTNNAQLLSGNQAMLNHFQAIASLQQNIPLAQQLASQTGTILSTQPLYIRTTGPILQPQTVIGNVQAVAPTLGKSGSDVRGQLRTVVPGQGVKAVPNILPHIARTTTPVQTSQRMLSVASATQGGATSKGVQTSHSKQMAKVRTPKNQTSKTSAVGRNMVQQQHHSWSGATAGGCQPPTAKVQPKPVQQMKKSDATKCDAKMSSAPLQATQKASTSMLVAPSPTPVANSSIVQVLCHTNGKAADKLVVATTSAKTVIPAIGTAAEQPKLSQLTATGGATTTSGNKKQRAIVKPHILTHVIEGFIIQEAAEPFPVERSSLLTDSATCQPPATSEKNGESASVQPTQETISAPDTASVLPKMKSRSKSQSRRHGSGNMTKLKCEFCGKIDFAYKFRRSKRFCSMACAKRYNVGCSRRMALFKTTSGARYVRKKRSSHMKIWKQSGGRISSGPLQRTDVGFDSGEENRHIIDDDAGATSAPSVPESSTESSEPSGSCSGHEESSSPRSPPELQRVTDMEVEGEEVLPPSRKHPSQWTVSEVLQFIQDLPGCCVYADEFSRQEIDGQALMLLKEDHLMTTMNIKLGPALKICARINTLKDELS